MDNLQCQKNIVEDLHARMESLQSELYSVKMNFEFAQREFQKICPHKEYTSELDDDYHSSKYYYTCTFCGFVTRMKPK